MQRVFARRTVSSLLLAAAIFPVFAYSADAPSGSDPASAPSSPSSPAELTEVERAHLKRLREGNPEEKIAAIKALTELRSVASVPVFLEALGRRLPRTEEDPVADALEQALRQVEPSGVPFLVDALRKHAWTFLRGPLVRILSKLESEESRRVAAECLVRQLRNEKIAFQMWASWDIVVNLNSESATFPKLQDRLGYTEEAMPATNTVYTLSSLRSAAVPALIPFVESDEPDERRVGARLLFAAGMRAKRLGLTVESILKHENADVRAVSAEALLFVREYVKAVGEDPPDGIAPDRLVYRSCEQARVDRERIEAALRKSLEDSFPKVRSRAAISLARLFPLNAPTSLLVPRLEEALDDSDPLVSQRAAMLLVRLLKAESGHRSLGRARQIVLETLRFTDEMLRAEEESNMTVAAWEAGEHLRYAVESIATLGDGAVPDLIRRLRNSDFRVRAPAALTLSEIGPKARSAVPDLLKGLEDEHWTVRAASSTALAKVGLELPGVREAVERMLSDENETVRGATKWALRDYDSTPVH